MNRVPSPADFARRVAPAAPAVSATPLPPIAQAIEPGKLGPNETFKPTYTWGLLISGMLPETRLLGHTILWYARYYDGHIPPTFAPNVDKLSAGSGLTPTRVQTHLEILRQRGWLRLTSIPTGPRAGSPRFDLTIPSLYLERVRAKRADREAINQARRASQEKH